MAYVSGNLHLGSALPPGRNSYTYHTEDHPDVVETAGYFNNKDDDLNLAKGDTILVTGWSSTIHDAASTVDHVRMFSVTNVIANDAAVAAGNVNVAETLSSVGGAISSNA